MLTSKVKTNVYLDAEIRDQANEIFKRYGISLSDAINLFLTQSVKEEALLFKIPNEETKQAIQEARAGINGETISFEDLQRETKQCLQ
jgi:DNA-damage-inducible protein J